MHSALSALLAISLTICCSALSAANAQTIPATDPRSTATPPDSKPSSNNAELRERVQQWWTARKNGDHRKMYELYSPQMREQRPYDSFVAESVARSRIPLDGFDIVSFETIDPSRALAKLKLHLVVPAGHVTTDMEEHWIMADGQWFKSYTPPVVPRPPPGMQGKIVVPGSAREQAVPAK